MAENNHSISDRCPKCEGFLMGGLPYGHSCGCYFCDSCGTSFSGDDTLKSHICLPVQEDCPKEILDIMDKVPLEDLLA